MGIVCYIAGMKRLLIGTSNLGKKEEYAHLLAPLGLCLCSPHDLGLTLGLEEIGESYAENARIKAVTYQRACGLLTLADDSGLEVDALGGKPGLHSARYGGPGADDAARYRLLLRKLDGVPWESRSARFRCVIVVVTPGGEIHTTEGVCEGRIAFEPKGEHGFGYDPIFYVPEYAQTMSQLAPGVKNRISHRARALERMVPILAAIVTESAPLCGEN
jgi:XTP/dITP diphosphohydrolase